MDKKPTRTVAYIRVSTDKQADFGNSLETQRAKIEAYANLFDLELIAVEVDAGESAGSLDRPGLQRALSRLDSFEASALLVVKLDRLTRSVCDLGELVDTYFKDGTCSLMSVSEQIDTRSAGGRMVLNILTVIGQWEREAIGERTAAVMQHMKARGEYTGGWPPFGYVIEDGKLVPEPREQHVIAEVRRLRAGGMSLRSIARAIGVQRGTKVFDAKQIARMCV